jgi:hypothetical protein
LRNASRRSGVTRPNNSLLNITARAQAQSPLQ